MSGGVDSSVVAALLKQQGQDVIGITLQLYDHGSAVGRTRSCCAGQDIHDARRVAEQIGIPHYVLDYEARFREAVIESFADSYIAGETPIPCVACNQQIKFLDLLETAKELGADAMATGHYIVRRDGPHGPELYCGPDSDRDQSYFLFATTREQLDFLRFPLGTLTKQRVRELADEMGLAVAHKSDSQDICFVPAGRYGDVIAKIRPNATAPGEIVHIDGRILGRHEGIIHFTIGQRRGLGVADQTPLYVIRLDSATRQVIVGPREALKTTRLKLRDINWLSHPGLAESPAATQAGMRIYARFRSSQAQQPATVRFDTTTGETLVTLHGGAHGIAPGQACVFYDNEGEGARILGGGWIVEAHPDSMGTQSPTLEAASRAPTSL
jgi:tRNA-uridine 2-sulfurtransferase